MCEEYHVSFLLTFQGVTQGHGVQHSIILRVKYLNYNKEITEKTSLLLNLSNSFCDSPANLSNVLAKLLFCQSIEMDFH